MSSKRVIAFILILTLMFASIPAYAEDGGVTEHTESQKLFVKLYNKFSTVVSSTAKMSEIYDVLQELKGQGLVAELEELLKSSTHAEAKAALLAYGINAEVVGQQISNFLAVIPSKAEALNSNSDNIFVKMLWDNIDGVLNYYNYAADLKELTRTLYLQLPSQIIDQINLLDGDKDGEVRVYSKLLNIMLEHKIGEVKRNTSTLAYYDARFYVNETTKTALVNEINSYGVLNAADVEALASAFYNQANVLAAAAEIILVEKGLFDQAVELALDVDLLDVILVTPPVIVIPGPAATPLASINIVEAEVEIETGTEAVTRSYQLEPTVFNSTATVLYESSDPDVATVSEDGLIESANGGDAGEARITATLEGTTVSDSVLVVVFLVGTIESDIDEDVLGEVTFLKPYISGITPTSFGPYAKVTRAQVATMFTIVLEYDSIETSAPSFNDVSEDHWAYGNIQAIAEKGLFTGYDDGTFRPDKPITRAEIMAVFSNYWKSVNSTIDDTRLVFVKDVPSAHWASGYINQGFNFGLVSGYGDNTFRPENKTTRAEMVVMVNKLLGRKDLVVEKSKFGDVLDNHWAKNAIEAAASLQVEKNAVGN